MKYFARDVFHRYDRGLCRATGADWVGDSPKTRAQNHVEPTGRKSAVPIEGKGDR